MADESYAPDRRHARQQLHDAIQGTTGGSSQLEDTVLVGWVLVAEWMDGDGERWLSNLSGCNGGESSPPSWQAQGYLHNTLHEGWTKYNTDEN